MASIIGASVLNGSSPSQEFMFTSSSLKLVVKTGSVKLQEKIDGSWYDVGHVFQYQGNVSQNVLPVVCTAGTVIYITPADSSAVLRLVPIGGAASAEAWNV